MNKKQDIKIIQDMDKAIAVMYNVGTWLQESGKHPSKWWQPQNMNREFLLQYVNPDEFYVVLVNGQPTASAILQYDQRNQSWESVDKDKPKEAVYIHWLCVAREFAGKQLPELLIDFAATKAKEKNISLLRVDTNASEIKLRKLYEDLGFDLAGIEQEEYRQTAFYQKLVNEPKL